MSFGSPKKVLVLLITETSVQLLLWQQGALKEILALTGSPADQDRFVAIIRDYPKHPVIVVTDLIDENFRHDTVVHVGGSDRDALLKRKLDFAFRNTRYRIGLVTGRLPEGRKDDKIMLCAITKPERIDVWARLLLEERMPIIGVTSVAHLLSSYLPLEKLEQEEYLIITKLDQHNNLRQTFVNKGKVAFSRLASLGVVPEERLGIEILQESTQLRQYLERIQFIPYEARLRILVLSGQSRESLQLETYSSELNTFEAVNIDEAYPGLGFEMRETPLQPSHYLVARILEKKSIANIYAPASVTRYNDLKTFAGTLLAAAASVFVLGLGLNIPGALNVLDKWSQADTFAARTAPLRREYQTLTDRFPETPIPPREMALVVGTHELISERATSPVEELNLLADALNSSPGLVIRSINWELQEKRAADDGGEGRRPAVPRDYQALSGNNLVTSLILQELTQIKLLVTGEAYSPDSFREAQNQVLRFRQALQSYPQVTVQSAKLPVDTNDNTEVSTTLNDSEVRADFTIELVIDKHAPAAGEQLAEAPR